MNEFETMLQEASMDDLESMKDRYFELHRQAREADNAVAGANNPNRSSWDDDVKEYMEKLRQIDNEMLSRQG